MIDALLPAGSLDYITQMSIPENAELHAVRSRLPNLIMCIGPQIANFLQFLARISGARRCLEIGSFTGYSALSLAWAIPEEGQVITLEKDPRHAQMAQTNFKQSAVGQKIELRMGDAVEILPEISGTFDLIFIDADKINYPTYLEMSLEKLKPQGLIIMDNALYDFEVLKPQSPQAQAIHECNLQAQNTKGVETLMLPLRDGLLLIRKQ